MIKNFQQTKKRDDRPLPSAKKEIFLMLLCALAATASSRAQQNGVVGQTERQIKILQERSAWAQTQTAKATVALANNDFESAFALSKSAVDALPAGGNAAQIPRSLAMENFTKASLALAKQRISEGRFDDAELVVKTAVEKPYESTNPALLTLQKKLEDPNQFNRTMTPGFISKVAQVEELLSEAQGLYNSGRYDAAFKNYEKVINLDPQNISARLGMEQVNKQRAVYAENAYNERRGQMLADVAHAWEIPVPKFDTGASVIVEQAPINIKGASNISRKLNEIKIPHFSLTDASIQEAIEKLQNDSRTYDTTETDPAKKGVNIVLKPITTPGGESKVTLNLDDIPLRVAVDSLATAANLHIKIDPYAVVFVPPSDSTENFITRKYTVPPGFMSSASLPPAGGPALPSAGLPSTSGAVGQTGVKEYLMTQGVQFPPGSSAIPIPSSSTLVVKNTQANLDLIDQIMENDSNSAAKQVEIKARFLEVQQKNLQELGFDWLMGAMTLPAGTGFAGGGTVGNQAASSVGSYPFVSPAGVPAGAMSASGGNVTAGNVTAGNRTGAAAIQANALDALLFGAPTGPAPGILALAGIFTNPQFQVVLRALNQQTGVDILSEPNITVYNGRSATITVAQRFPYPKEYSPPQIPQSQSGGGAPATPATPTSFENRDVGVNMDIQPTIGADGNTIDLQISPQVTQFEGFVNYGTPISTLSPVVSQIGTNQIALSTKSILLTPNVIDQPIFSVQEVKTQVTLYNGETVALGGLMREDVQKVQDKTPIAGDLPLVGSLFRSSATQRIKKSLLIFVTVNLIDPAGQPLIQEMENHEDVMVPNAKAVTSEAVPGDASTASKSSQ